jgi:hypothetical protein
MMIDARAKIAIGGTLNAIYGRDMDFLAIRYVGALAIGPAKQIVIALSKRSRAPVEPSTSS